MFPGMLFSCLIDMFLVWNANKDDILSPHQNAQNKVQVAGLFPIG